MIQINNVLCNKAFAGADALFVMLRIPPGLYFQWVVGVVCYRLPLDSILVFRAYCFQYIILVSVLCQ